MRIMNRIAIIGVGFAVGLPISLLNRANTTDDRLTKIEQALESNGIASGVIED